MRLGQMFRWTNKWQGGSLRAALSHVGYAAGQYCYVICLMDQYSAGEWGIHETFGDVGWQVQSGMKLCDCRIKVMRPYG